MTWRSEVFTFRLDFCRVRDYSLSGRVFSVRYKSLRLKVQLGQWYQIIFFSSQRSFKGEAFRLVSPFIGKNLRTIKCECIDEWRAFFSSNVFETWRRNVECVFQKDHCSHHITWICFELPPFIDTKEKFRDQIIFGTRKFFQCQDYKISLTMSQSVFLRFISSSICQIHSWMIFMS